MNYAPNTKPLPTKTPPNPLNISTTTTKLHNSTPTPPPPPAEALFPSIKTWKIKKFCQRQKKKKIRVRIFLCENPEFWIRGPQFLVKKKKKMAENKESKNKEQLEEVDIWKGWTPINALWRKDVAKYMPPNRGPKQIVYKHAGHNSYPGDQEFEDRVLATFYGSVCSVETEAFTNCKSNEQSDAQCIPNAEEVMKCRENVIDAVNGTCKLPFDAFKYCLGLDHEEMFCRFVSKFIFFSFSNHFEYY